VKLPAAIAANLLAATALAFTFGIALALATGPHLPARGLTLLGAGLLAVALLLLAGHAACRQGLPPWLLLPLFLAAGYWHGQCHLRPPPADDLFWQIEEKTETLVVGTLVAMVSDDGTFSRAEIIAEQFQRRGDHALSRCRGRLLVRLPGSWPEELRPGDRLALRADLRRPEGFRTPGSFDLAAHFARQGIRVTGTLRSPLFLTKLEIPQPWWHHLRYWPERFRSDLGRALDAALPDLRQSGMYRALLLGDRSRLSPEILENFKASGTFHLLAISGLHVAILTTLLFAASFHLLSRSEWLLLRWPVRKVAALFCLPLLLGYGLLAGLNTPVTRAVLMASLVLVAICLEREKSPTALLAFAAMAILLNNPFHLATASFQLSFAAVAALLFLLPRLQQLLYRPNGAADRPSLPQRAGNWLLAGLLVSTVRHPGDRPDSHRFFQRISLVGPVATLLIEPLLCLWSLGIGFLAIPLLLLQPESGALLLRLGAFGLEAALAGAAWFASLPFASLRLPPPPFWLLAAITGRCCFPSPAANGGL
jgi:competence protein ComEC